MSSYFIAILESCALSPVSPVRTSRLHAASTPHRAQGSEVDPRKRDRARARCAALHCGKQAREGVHARERGGAERRLCALGRLLTRLDDLRRELLDLLHEQALGVRLRGRGGAEGGVVRPAEEERHESAAPDGERRAAAHAKRGGGRTAP